MLMRVQLVWLVRELVKSGVIGADGVIMTLLKQIAGQTHTDRIAYIEHLVSSALF